MLAMNRSSKLVVTPCLLGTLLHDRFYLRHCFERAMDRALAGDFADLLAKLLRDLAIDGNDALETIDPAAATAFQLGALLAIPRMDLGMRDVDGDASELQLLVAGIEAQRHRGAGAKCDRQEVVGRWSGIKPAYAFGFIGEQPMPASLNSVLKLPSPVSLTRTYSIGPVACGVSAAR